MACLHYRGKSIKKSQNWILTTLMQRGHIDNDQEWFSIFNIIFELVSAYATVGLSLGVPYDNYS